MYFLQAAELEVTSQAAYIPDLFLHWSNAKCFWSVRIKPHVVLIYKGYEQKWKTNIFENDWT